MSDIFREVDEALNKEKAAQFWKNYGPTLLLAAVILVASTAALRAHALTGNPLPAQAKELRDQLRALR